MTIDEKRRQKKLAKKAAERKTKQVERRSLSTGGSPTVAAEFPIGDCLIPTNLFQKGLGNLVLTRVLPNGRVALAAFLVDVFCLGVRDAAYCEMSHEEFEWHRQEQQSQSPMASAHPECLRKLVEGAVHYAQALGLTPHPDYAKASRLFGDIDAAACRVRYKFGSHGKPLYINAPHESPAQQRKIIDALKRQVGEDGFEYICTPDHSQDAGDQQFSTSFAQITNYAIVDAPPGGTPLAQLPESVQKTVTEFYQGVVKNPGESIPHLLELIEQYPDLPQNYNYLQIAYKLIGDQENAQRALQETLERFPDYLFGWIAQANDCFEKGEIDRIPEIFKGQTDLGALYPHRKQFHISEVLNFSFIMGRYFHVKGEKNRAESYIKLMKQLDPTHKTTRRLDEILHPKPRRTRNWTRQPVSSDANH